MRTDPKTLGLAGVAQVVRIHSHVQVIRQGNVTKETDEVRFAVTSYWPEEATAHNDCWKSPAATGASKTGNTIAGTALRTRTAARCGKPLRRAIFPCFAP